jgi:hypothetical protein
MIGGNGGLRNRMYLTVAPPADGNQQAEIRRLEAMLSRR